MIARIHVLSSREASLAGDRQVQGCGITYSVKLIDLIKGDFNQNKNITFCEHVNLKTGTDYLVFLTDVEGSETRHRGRDQGESEFKFTSSFVFELTNDNKGKPGNELLWAIYRNVFLKMPEQLGLVFRKHLLCEYPEMYSSLSDNEECQTFRLEALIDWVEFKDYISEKQLK